MVSLAIVLYPHARPKLEKDNVDGGKGCIIKLDRGFDFPGADYLEDVLVQSATYGKIISLVTENPCTRVLRVTFTVHDRKV
mgnify:CR=1 FL=1